MHNNGVHDIFVPDSIKYWQMLAWQKKINVFFVAKWNPYKFIFKIISDRLEYVLNLMLFYRSY